MIRALVPAIAALALLAIACQSSTPTPAPTATASFASAGCASAEAAAGDFGRTLSVAGAERTYVVHAPAGLEPSVPAPLVIAFPAAEMSAEAFAGVSNLPATADAAGFLLVVLNAAGAPPSWGAADPGFAEAVLEAVSAERCVDTSRVFLAGYSSGGGAAQAATCALDGRVAALAAVASTFGRCRANTPLIAFHGTEDPVVPFEDAAASVGDPTPMTPVRRYVSEWAQATGCDGLATISRPSPAVELATYNRCFGGDGEVLLYAIIGGGHTWPGSPVQIESLGSTTREIDASRLIWDFFAAHPKAR